MDIRQIRISDNCRFHYGECEDAWYKGYDDAGWENVILPHDYSVAAPFSKEYSSGTGYVRGGIAWYRLYVRLPEELKGKRLTLVFDGIYNNSKVWVNSYYCGKRPYGYSEISYDISDIASFGDDLTQISVKVAHTDLADSRWFTGSGIYRNVYIIATEKVSTTLHGVFFRTDFVKNKDGRLTAGISVRNEIAFDGENTDIKEVTVENRLLDADDNEVLLLKGKLNSLNETVTELSGELSDPRTWSVDDPYLYTLETRVSTGGESYLTDREKVGIRTIRFDPDKGFFLNEEPSKFYGVCLHHDGGCLGAAMKKEVWRRRLELLKKSGCNAIRCSHNPHMPQLYELCDEMGFLVMDEAFDEWENPKNKWSTGHNVYPPKHQGYYEDFPMWHEIDLRTMIKRDRNHPSVVLYSIGNEIDYPNDPYCHPLFTEMTGNNDKNKPAKERQYDPAKPNMERLSVIAGELAGIVKDEDSTRPATVAAAFPELSTYIGFINELEVVGYNYKEHLYEKDHERFPDKTFLGSENGHSIEAFNAVKDNEYICGQFLWTGIDYLGEAFGWPIHGAGAGYITSAGFPKKEYYERARLWNKEVPVPSPVKEITAYVWEPEITPSCPEDEFETGYLYQVIVRAPYEGEEKLSWNGKCPEGAGKPSQEMLITAQVVGGGELAGLDNGDMSDLTPYTSNQKKTFNGNMVVYVRRTCPGPITLNLYKGSDLTPFTQMTLGDGVNGSH